MLSEESEKLTTQFATYGAIATRVALFVFSKNQGSLRDDSWFRFFPVEPLNQEISDMKFIGKLLATLLFIVALLYLAGLVWTSICGSQVPPGVRWFYPWLPNA